MAAESAASLVLQVEPCKSDPGLYRWIIRDHDRVVRQACYSLASKEEARTEGRAALEEAEAMVRDSS
ncbi:hypothetical protein [Methylobacterium oxalidis]|uniref:DUF1508 domain-containing protein n=1 Tax=Methylobacterium oxalidis TaxID=944322 RepID=A0A512JCX3_9HYPH|nr:hypothetical protein [Methylobacterium oxalidis]GEP07812.1 hypothetical protein MOX02_58500 [Methylobacterium oxalidis]GJE35153.1 hypothetical protein LDDCCGHA_5371 [Methylobacterium oxalidis]GLS64598.1 hypothetical protein GCM10007888_29790 [Methylobacterium oxalidis]